MNEGYSFMEFIKAYGTFFLALYGIAQYWLFIFLKKYIWTGRISIFKTGFLEVGYSNFGPTLALNGTLRAERNDVFIQDISLAVTRKRDNSTSTLEWTAFRSPQLKIAGSLPQALEIPSGFNISVTQPYRYHIVFSDRQTQAEIVPYLVEVRSDWEKYLMSKGEEIKKGIREGGASHELIMNDLYVNEFSKQSKKFAEAWDILNRKNYWEPGDYCLLMTVSTHGPVREFKRNWEFTIDETSFENLRLNSVITLRELCLGKAQYNYAYLKYE